MKPRLGMILVSLLAIVVGLGVVATSAAIDSTVLGLIGCLIFAMGLIGLAGVE